MSKESDQNQSFYIRPSGSLPACGKAVILPGGGFSYQKFRENQSDNIQDLSILPGVKAFSRGEEIFVSSFIGAPLVAMVLEELISSGVRHIWLIGIGGGLTFSLTHASIGDIVFPRGAISEEGTSKLYGGKEKESFSGKEEHQEKLEASLRKNFPANEIHEGLIWSTDAPYRETPEKAQHYTSQGAVMVDMEFAATRQVASVYDCQLSAVFVVSDLLGETWENGLGSAKLKSRLGEIVEMVCTNSVDSA